MKTLTLLSLAFTLFTSAFADVRPEEGNERGNGGDEYAKEFVRTAYDVLESITKDPIPGVDNKALLEAIRRTKVSSRPSLTLRGNEVDAINYPDANEPRILISRAGWDRMKTAGHRRAFLALHEYLSIMGVDDSSYQVSMLLDRAGVCERNSEVRRSIELTVRKFCYRITAEDLHFMGPTFFAGSRDQQGEPEALRGRDFMGIDLAENFHLNLRVSRLHGDTFDGAPSLRHLSMLSPAQIDVLNAHPRLWGIYLHGAPARQIADGAFSRIKGLRNLSVALDGSLVSVEKALSGLNMLKELQVVFHRVETAPVGLIEIVRQNAELNRVTILVAQGKIGSVESRLKALGFECKFARDLDIPGEKRECSRP